uniref:Reticulon-like protein n=1 Tax=Panagrellus redivivus TaxID=6233 RepID=A0A7E4UZY8_PANRE
MTIIGNFVRIIVLFGGFGAAILGLVLYLEDVYFTYEIGVGLLFFLSMYPYVTWLLRYHEPLIKAQNLLSKDMMRRMHFEAPQFIEMGFKDLQCSNAVDGRP